MSALAFFVTELQFFSAEYIVAMKKRKIGLATRNETFSVTERGETGYRAQKEMGPWTESTQPDGPDPTVGWLRESTEAGVARLIDPLCVDYSGGKQ